MKKLYFSWVVLFVVGACRTQATGQVPASTTSAVQSALAMQVYHDFTHNLTFEYPADWFQVGPLEFQGPDGFLKITELPAYHSRSVFHACVDFLTQHLPPDGFELEQIPLNSGCLIIPESSDSQKAVSWIFRYRDTLHAADFLLLETNYLYHRTFIDSLGLDSRIVATDTPGQPSLALTQMAIASNISIKETHAGKVKSNPDRLEGIDTSDHGVNDDAQPPTPNCGQELTVLSNKLRADRENYSIRVQQDNQIIFTIPTLGPDGGVHSFCEWAGHWVLETQEFVILDGRILNHEYGYDEMFDWRLVAGKPFFFFSQNGFVYLSYDSQTLPVAYDYIPHYGCCEAGYARNPHGNDSLIWFYGARDGVWYYTELSFTIQGR